MSCYTAIAEISEPSRHAGLIKSRILSTKVHEESGVMEKGSDEFGDGKMILSDYYSVKLHVSKIIMELQRVYNYNTHFRMDVKVKTSESSALEEKSDEMEEFADTIVLKHPETMVQNFMSPNKSITYRSTHGDENVFLKTSKDSTGGCDTPAKYMTMNLLQTDNGKEDEQQHTNIRSNMYSLPEGLQSAINLPKKCHARPDEVHRKDVHVYNISQLVHKFSAAVKDGALQTKHKTGSLTSSEHDNNDEHVQDVEKSLIVSMVTRPPDSDDEHLEQEAIIPGNVIVGGEQASVDGPTCITQCIQGQSQSVVECGNVKVPEAATPLSFVVCSDGQMKLLNRSNFSLGKVQVLYNRGSNDCPIGRYNSLHSGVRCGGTCTCPEPSLSSCPVVNGVCVTCSVATSVVCHLGGGANEESCTGVNIRQMNGMLRINGQPDITGHATGLTLIRGALYGSGVGLMILVHPVCTETQQQLLQGPSYIRGISMVCNEMDMPSYLTYTQPFQQAPHGQGTNGSLIPIGTGPEPSLSSCPVVNGVYVTCSLATSVVCHLGGGANEESCTDSNIRQMNGMLRINGQPDITGDATGLALIRGALYGSGVGPMILVQPVCTETQQLLQGPSYMRDTQPFQRASHEQGTNGSLIPMGNDTCTGSELSLLQCSNNAIAVTTCDHCHDVGVKCGAPHIDTTLCLLAQFKCLNLCAGMITNANSASKLNNTLTSEDLMDHNIGVQCESVTPAKLVTGNLLKSQNNNEEHQHTHITEEKPIVDHAFLSDDLSGLIKPDNTVAIEQNHVVSLPMVLHVLDHPETDEGVRQQIDSHPSPLPPVEEEIHTKPSQQAHVHTDENEILMDDVEEKSVIKTGKQFKMIGKNYAENVPAVQREEKDKKGEICEQKGMRRERSKREDREVEEKARNERTCIMKNGDMRRTKTWKRTQRGKEAQEVAVKLNEQLKQMQVMGDASDVVEEKKEKDVQMKKRGGKKTRREEKELNNEDKTKWMKGDNQRIWRRKWQRNEKVVDRDKNRKKVKIDVPQILKLKMLRIRKPTCTRTVQMNGERHKKVPIKFNEQGHIKEAIKDLEAREESANSKSRNGVWEERKQDRKRRQYTCRTDEQKQGGRESKNSREIGDKEKGFGEQEKEEEKENGERNQNSRERKGGWGEGFGKSGKKGGGKKGEKGGEAKKGGEKKAGEKAGGGKGGEKGGEKKAGEKAGGGKGGEKGGRKKREEGGGEKGEKEGGEKGEKEGGEKEGGEKGVGEKGGEKREKGGGEKKRGEKGGEKGGREKGGGKKGGGKKGGGDGEKRGGEKGGGEKGEKGGGEKGGAQKKGQGEVGVTVGGQEKGRVRNMYVSRESREKEKESYIVTKSIDMLLLVLLPSHIVIGAIQYFTLWITIKGNGEEGGEKGREEKGGEKREKKGQGEVGGGTVREQEKGRVRNIYVPRESREKERFKSIGIKYFMLLLVLLPSGTNASVVLSPSHDYTTFENNASTFTFSCSGNGAHLVWTVDRYTTGSLYVLNKGITTTHFIVSSDEIVSSQLIVPTTKPNSNITVICVVQNSSFIPQSSNAVRLFLQGVLPPPEQFQMNFSNSSVNLSWIAPESLNDVSPPPTISSYIISNNITNKMMSLPSPSTCGPLASCNYSLDLKDTFFRIVNGGVDKTILDYNGPVEFTFFAVNGAGNGSAATYMYVPSRNTPTDVTSHPNETIPRVEITRDTPASIPINGVVIGIIVPLNLTLLIGIPLLAITVIVKKRGTLRPRPPVLLRSVKPPAPHEREDPPSHSTVV